MFSYYFLTIKMFKIKIINMGCVAKRVKCTILISISFNVIYYYLFLHYISNVNVLKFIIAIVIWNYSFLF